MGRALRLRACVLAAAALCAIPACTHAQAASQQTGVYNEAQAARGDTVFRTVCASCHSTTEFNNPQFRSTWSGKNLFTLFDQLRSTMPQDTPGSLTRQQYVDVIAYIIKLNGHPAGEAEIPSEDEALRTVSFPQKAAAPAPKRR